MDIDNQVDVVEESSIRSDLEQAFADVETAEPEKIDRVRDESGKFAKKDELKEDVKVEPAALLEPAPPVVNDIPSSWKNKDPEAWAKVPDAVKAEIRQREKEVELGFTKLDEDRNFGKSIKEVVAPYMPIIQAEGGTVATAVQSLLNTAYILRTAQPAQKEALFHQLAKQYGVNLNNPSAVQPDQGNQVLLEKIQQLEQQIQQQPEVFKQQQETQAIQSVIDVFAADPKNIHYEKLKPVMASLLTSGGAKDMQDAYDKASWADPEIRPTLQTLQTPEQKRIADIQAKADKARKTAVSVKGSPSINAAPSNKSNGSIREDLEAAFDMHA